MSKMQWTRRNKFLLIIKFITMTKTIFFSFILITTASILNSCTTECKRCNGKGYELQYVDNECNTCLGTGQTACTYSFTNNGILSSTTYKCSHGKYTIYGGSGINTGLLAGDKCSNCNGSGLVNCNHCSGSGHNGTKGVRRDCRACDGKGRNSHF